MDFARRVTESREPELLCRPGVIGLGVGATEADPTIAAIVIYLGVPVRIVLIDPFVAL